VSYTKYEDNIWGYLCRRNHGATLYINWKKMVKKERKKKEEARFEVL
jgi:hypothetical protein